MNSELFALFKLHCLVLLNILNLNYMSLADSHSLILLLNIQTVHWRTAVIIPFPPHIDSDILLGN